MERRRINISRIYPNEGQIKGLPRNPRIIKNGIHPTMKPVALVGNVLKDATVVGDICLDVFGGSGTSIIACEQLRRKCRMMELDPHYCDVIIARWENLTGNKAKKWQK